MASASNAHSNAVNGGQDPQLKDVLSICWVDSHICEVGQHTQMKADCQRMSNLISEWQFFDSSDSFQDYINRHPHKKIITIISGRFARTLLALVSLNENMHSFYVFTISIERNRAALGTEPKLKGIFNTEPEVFEAIKADLSELFWDEGTRLAGLHRDQEARIYFDEAKRLTGHLA